MTKPPVLTTFNGNFSIGDIITFESVPPTSMQQWLNWLLGRKLKIRLYQVTWVSSDSLQFIPYSSEMNAVLAQWERDKVLLQTWWRSPLAMLPTHSTYATTPVDFMSRGAHTSE